MNIRFDAGSLRFRIEQNEIETLLLDGRLSLSLPWTKSVTDCTIILHDQEAMLHFVEAKHVWELYVSRKAFETMSSKGFSKQGLEEMVNRNGHAMELSLEINIRRPRN